MNRYFTVEPTAYEQTRLAMDAAWPFPAGETSIEPLETAAKDGNGNVLIAIRSTHCDMEPFQSAIASLLGSNAATEITQADYEAASAEAVTGLQS